MDNHNQTSVTEFILLSFSTTRFPALIATLVLLIYSVIALGNILLMLVIQVNSNLHTPMYFFILQISILDVCNGSSVVPQLAYNLLSVRHAISFHRCAVQVFCTTSFCAVQVFMLSVMGYDRYVAIANPLHYKNIMRWAICIVLLCATWIIGLMIGLTLVLSVFLLPYCNSNTIQHFMCDVGELLKLSCSSDEIRYVSEAICYLIGLGMFCIPFLLIIISYVYIISALLKIRTNEGRHKAFSTCSSHLTVVTVGFICIGFLYFRTKESIDMDKEKVTSVFLVLGSPILNPIIYSIRNKAVKEGLIKLFSNRYIF